ncbi:hypothetical protein ID47_03715 [Candidatus Paracaedibacter acanthamoebae]|uniref:Uncharacterized protein n=2 Tax=Candidatus Odyssella acanthamoebae TaxID=91604 RepID=A0A077AZ72_9PROT|nr:hypothetical protein ID47_03715 [Candidatus Paracaedibacter acanthamoebae]
MKQTPFGLKFVDLDDKSVLCTYAIPDLLKSVNVRFFKVHQPHGNETFSKKTLGFFFKPQLISAGYCPADLLPEQQSSPSQGTSSTATAKSKSIKKKKAKKANKK